MPRNQASRDIPNDGSFISRSCNAARKRGKNPGRPKLDTETVSALQKLVKAGMTPGTAAKQLGIGRSTAYRVAKALD
jgi:DNA invertase Pin-like site-specific DNA recombinase